MRNDCAIVRDLLPLYVENMVHEDTADFVKEHLLACTECSKEAELLKIPVVEEVKPEAAPLKKLKKKLLRNRIQTVLLTVLLVSTLVMAVFSYLTAPQYFPYTADLLTVRENGDGSVTVQFAEKVTGYSLYEISSPDTNSTDSVSYTHLAGGPAADGQSQRHLDGEPGGVPDADRDRDFGQGGGGHPAHGGQAPGLRPGGDGGPVDHHGGGRAVPAGVFRRGQAAAGRLSGIAYPESNEFKQPGRI